jgi:Zn-dependent protease with chaperone function/TM2 domain-containing membrane protein YozV
MAYLIFLLVAWWGKIAIVARVKGDGICVTEKQFPDVHSMYCDMAGKLGLKKIPPLFVLQENGILNSFALRLSGRDYIAICSEIFSVYKYDIEAVKFILAQELAHVKRNHALKNSLTFPSAFIPFLHHAYSSVCEYNCDNIASCLIPDEKDRIKGVLLLAGGKHLYREIDTDNYLEAAKQNKTLAVKFGNSLSNHPNLPDRIENLKNAKPVEYPMGYIPKDRKKALLLCIFSGLLGMHRFYAGKIKEGLIFLIGPVMAIILLAFYLIFVFFGFRQSNSDINQLIDQLILFCSIILFIFPVFWWMVDLVRIIKGDFMEKNGYALLKTGSDHLFTKPNKA